MPDEVVVDAPTHGTTIWVAGDALEAERICRRYCMAVGLCVTISSASYVYTGGAESGVRIGLLNYPRFPTTTEALREKAFSLARALRDGLCQWSVMVETPDRTYWLTTREARENG